jgi:serine/threonine protein kinase
MKESLGQPDRRLLGLEEKNGLPFTTTPLSDAGVIHRDVKPSNMIVGRQSDIHAYLTDFGIGQVVSEEILGRLNPVRLYQTILEASSRSGTHCALDI